MKKLALCLFFISSTSMAMNDVSLFSQQFYLNPNETTNLINNTPFTVTGKCKILHGSQNNLLSFKALKKDSQINGKNIQKGTTLEINAKPQETFRFSLLAISDLGLTNKGQYIVQLDCKRD